MTSVLLVTYNTVGASIQGVTELKVKLKDHVCTLLDADKEKYGQTCIDIYMYNSLQVI